MRISRRKFGGLLAMLLAAVLFAGACSDSNDTRLRLVNNTGSTILFVYYSACTDDTWGVDRLGDNETVANGDDRLFDLDAGCWDLRADVSGGGSVTLFDVDIAENETFVWTVSLP